MEEPRNPYGKYMSVGWQLIGGLAIGMIAGYFIDEWMGNKVPWATIILSVLMIIVGLYQLIKVIQKD